MPVEYLKGAAQVPAVKKEKESGFSSSGKPARDKRKQKPRREPQDKSRVDITV